MFRTRAALLFARVKRRPAFLAQVALVVLLGRWLDSYLLIAPAQSPLPSFPVYAVVATLLLVSGMLLRFARLSDVRGNKVLLLPELEMGREKSP